MSLEIKQQNHLLKFLMSRKLAFVRHLLLLLPLASTFIPKSNDELAKTIPQYHELMNAIYEHGAFMFGIAIIVIYFNSLVLVPRLLFKNRYLAYTVCSIGLGILYFFGEYLHGSYAYNDFGKYIDIPSLSIKDFIDNILLPLVFLGATTGYKVFKKWMIDTRHLSELKEATLREELTSLKNQVNPHFLFNTLNNLNTLVQTDQQKASQVILGLSDVLRYQIYDSTKEKILLSKDIAMLEQFLMLEKIRRDNFRFEILTDGGTTGILIPPLLFIIFIENAMKHGADAREASYCKIKFTIAKGQLVFDCRNSKPSVITVKEKGGFGLSNIRRRLDLLYGNAYSLLINDQPNLYTIKLTIPT